MEKEEAEQKDQQGGQDAFMGSNRNIIIVLLLIIIGAVTLIAIMFLRGTLVSDPRSQIVNTDKLVHFYQPLNIEFVLPNRDWQIKESENISNFPDMLQSRLLLLNQRLNCGVAFIDQRQIFGTYQQVSFAERILTLDHAQLDGSYYVPEKSGITEFRDVRTPTVGEVRRYHYYWREGHQPNEILIYALDGSVISPECDNEASIILRSLVARYDETEINSSSNGQLFIQKGGMYFKDSDDGIVKKIFNPGIFYQTLIFHNDQLFANTETGVQIIDFKNKQTINTMGKKLSDTDTIYGFYVADNKVYYQMGPSACIQEITTGCPASLYEYDVNTGQVYVLLEEITHNHFRGISPGTNTLYMEQGYGDAGCLILADIIGYDLEQKRIVDEKNFSGCIIDYDSETSEPLEEESLKNYRDFTDQFIGNINDHLLIKDGKPVFISDSGEDEQFYFKIKLVE